MENMLSFIGKYNNNCKVYNSEIAEDEISLLYSVLNAKEFADMPIRIMPDHHLGKGCLIGFTSPLPNAINPSFVGVDIGCSVTCCITDAKVNKDEYALIEHRTKKEIPMGFNIHKKRIFDMKDFLKFVRTEYNKARSSCPELINDIYFNENYITSMLKRLNMDEGVFYKSLGTLGGGNHAIEFGTHNGCYTFMVHCGSRNFGNKVCKYWEKIASSSQIDHKLLKEEITKLKSRTSDKRELPSLIKNLTEEFKSRGCSNGYISGDNMIGYLTDMVIAQAYAKYNHKLICDIISNILRTINGAKVIETIQSIHNYVSFDDKMIRKSAIRSYKDEKMVIPFNMRDGLAICVGKSNEDWNCSAPHGAGRKMSRAKAKRELTMEEFAETMKDVYSTSICKGTLDESPMAYKDTDTIINSISDTCDILYMIKPIINIKATDGAELMEND